MTSSTASISCSRRSAGAILGAYRRRPPGAARAPRTEPWAAELEAGFGDIPGRRLAGTVTSLHECRFSLVHAADLATSRRSDGSAATASGYDRSIPPSPDIVPGVHGLGSSLVNWYLVEEGGRLTAVDAGLPGFGKTLSSDLSMLGHSLANIEALVLTHSDSDHTGLITTLRDAGARVLIRAEDEPTLRKPGPKSGDGKPINIVPQLRHPALLKLIAHMAVSGALRPRAFEGAETFAADDVLDVPGRPRVIATPGHTAGHSALYFEEKGVLFVGDALCTRNPVTGRAGAQVMPSALNVSTDQCFASLAAIETVPAQVLFPGHGDPWRDGAAQAVASAHTLGRS